MPDSSVVRRTLVRLTLFCAIACACLVSPATTALAWSDAARAWTYAWSIVLEAIPYILVGAIAAAMFERLAHRSALVALFATIAPGCDCSMNGFARSLGSLPPPVAGALIVWGSCCNPIALLTTYQILGGRLTLARMAGALAASLLIAAAWAIGRARFKATEAACQITVGQPALLEHFDGGLKSLVLAAVVGGAVLALFPDWLRAHSSPLFAAFAGALLSPCSSADPILARALMSTSAAHATFIVAAQCIDVRQISLLGRCFGIAPALLGAAAGAAGCWLATLIAR
jgi:uncharacterized membrane protein YraQ (UPF0718 family)